MQCAVASLGALWRAPLDTALTAAVIGVALALPLGAWLVVDSVSDVSARFHTTADVSVFLRVDIDDGRAVALAERVGRRSEVKAVRAIGRAEALEEFRAAMGMAAGLEALGNRNPLPAVLVVTPASRDAPSLDKLAAELAALPEAEFVQVDRDWLERLESILEVARRLLALLAGLLGAGVILVVGNTLRLSIEGRRAEVEIAKLFGASDAFVRRPFLYHGLFYGLAGATVACLLLAGGALYLEGPLRRLGERYAGQLTLAGPGPEHLLTLLLAGAGLGLLGAWLSVGRHLRAVEPR